jgi:hypothetical protein
MTTAWRGSSSSELLCDPPTPYSNDYLGNSYNGSLILVRRGNCVDSVKAANAMVPYDTVTRCIFMWMIYLVNGWVEYSYWVPLEFSSTHVIQVQVVYVHPLLGLYRVHNILPYLYV